MRREGTAFYETPDNLRWDPRLGSDRPRSGLLQFGRGRLGALIGEDEVHKVSVGAGGIFELQ
jgi:hypothetical protein